MARVRPLTRPTVALAALAAAVGCQPAPQPAATAGSNTLSAPSQPATTPPAAATQPSAVSHTFDDATTGIRFSYPANWAAQPTTGTTKLHAVASPADGSAVLTLDVPQLPPHIPGLIPVGLVASGYVDDVKKRWPDATGPAPAEVQVIDAQARRVALSGHDAAGHAGTDDAVLIVHGDRVYVLAVEAEPAGRPAATAALDEVVKSIQWSR